MSPNAQKILDQARQLPPDEREWLAYELLAGEEPMSDETVAAWQNEAGEPEAGHDEWVRSAVEEALADESGDVPHEEAMKHFHESIQRARRLKASA